MDHKGTHFLPDGFFEIFFYRLLYRVSFTGKKTPSVLKGNPEMRIDLFVRSFLTIGFHLFVLLFSGCVYDPVDAKLKVINETKTLLYFAYSPYKDLSSLQQEEVIKHGLTESYESYIYQAHPGDTITLKIPGRKGSWETYVIAAENARLRIYTFDLDTLKKYSWQDIIRSDRYMKKLDFTVADLDKTNWFIEIK